MTNGDKLKRFKAAGTEQISGDLSSLQGGHVFATKQAFSAIS